MAFLGSEQKEGHLQLLAKDKNCNYLFWGSFPYNYLIFSLLSSLWELMLQTRATTSGFMLVLCSKDFSHWAIFLALNYILKAQYVQNTLYVLAWWVFTVSYEMGILILKIGNVNLR